MRTAYLGTSEFAARVLRDLAATEHAPSLVVTPPDSKRGRGRRLAPPPAAEAARELGLEVHQSPDVNSDESLAALDAAAPEAIAVCAFGQIIRPALLERHEMLNVHPSLIPRWRGAAPIERAIMAGDQRTGSTIMRVTEGLDSGPVALQAEVPIAIEDYFDDVAGALAELSGALLVEALHKRAVGELAYTEQDEDRATYAEKIAPQERRLDPSADAAELAWKVRALNPHIGTYLEIEGGGRLGVGRARAAESGPGPGRIEPDEAGGVLLLGTASGSLALESLQPPGKRAMPAPEFMRGYPVPTAAV